jgi:diguanylate cyclase (GGDEF)-like protein/PAS domain S-box-containing protein
MLGVNWDVTSLRSLTSELAEKHELLHVTLQSIDDAVITADTDGLVTWLNPSAEKLTGWSCADALNKPLEMIYRIVHEQTRFHLDNPATECLRFGKRVGQNRNTVLLSQAGVEYGIEDSAAPICDAEKQMLGVVLVFRDVTEQRRLTSEMTYRATHDELTDVLNRSEFEARLEQCLYSVHREPGRHALLFIDLDQFKLVNDACGHTAGDQLLQQMAGLLTQSLREGDTLARLGGDEFGVILHHCSARMGKDIAQDICDRMDDFRFSYGERRFRIGTSIGLVPLDSRWDNTAAIMQAADTSCYAAKEAGRNRVHVWFDTDKEMRDRRGHMQWATRLEQSLDEGRFELYAQRLESLHQPGVLLDAEVLLRLRDDTGAIILPGAFLPAAERFHLATRIDRWVLQQSILTLAGTEDLSRIGKLWINLSGQSIGDRVFHKDAIQMLRSAGHAICERICLEITETAAVTNIADAANFIGNLRELGVNTALDDFGAGASSFGYLKSLKVDMLKIDGQFITRVLEDPLDEAAVRCFVDVANVVGLQTVAEHVQSAEVLERLREIGVDYAQGFLLHEPEPIDQLLTLQDCHVQRLESV